MALAQDLIELRSGNSVYRTNIFTFSEDQASWLVEGVDNVFTDQYFLNFGTSPTRRELELKDLTLVSLTQPTENRFIADLDLSALGIDLNFSLDSTLQGFEAGSRRSRREDVVTLSNTGSSAIDFTLLSYLDLDLVDFDRPLDKSFDDDSTVFANRTLSQTDRSGTLATITVDQAPTAVQVAEYPFLISQLKDGSRTVLQNTSPTLANSDGSALLQFNRRLNPDEAITFRFVKSLQATAEPEPVPEPVTLLGLGLVGSALLVLRRR
ncbi:MAG: PEP-CTERM sorting domain-containing protein [Nodosilinea sp.]